MNFAALANGAWLATNLPAWHRFRRALHRPAPVQDGILRHLLRAHAASAYGRAHGFADIRSYREFCDRVPVTTYTDLEPWVHRIMRGEPGILTDEPVTCLVPTGGSTGANKFIPFTAGLQREFNRAIGPWIVDLCRSHPSVAGGPAYWSISPALATDPPMESAVPIGFDDDGAYLGGVRRWLVAQTFAAPPALRLATDVEDFRYLTLLCLLRCPGLRLISVWHPSFLALLLDALPTHREELLRDLADGNCRRAAGMSPALRQAVAAPPRPDLARDHLRSFVSGSIILWPFLRVISCWGDAQSALPLADLRRRLPGRVRVQPKGLLATEAFVTIPFRERHPVAVCSHFYEFEDTSGNLLRTHELHAGETYAVIVTTGGGLWRYRLGDQVEVAGFVAATPSLRFVGREGGVSDLRGEKLAPGFVVAALRVACAGAGFVPAFAMLAPETPPGNTEPPRYVCFIEEPPPMLAARLEAALRENVHYALCRDLGQLGPVEVCALAAGSGYRTYCDALLSEGKRLGEIKPQTLSTRPGWRARFGVVPRT